MMTQIFGVVRTLLAFGAGVFVSKGYFDSATADTIVGAVVTLLTAGWSIFEKRGTTTGA